jgi:hypothetical protein
MSHHRYSALAVWSPLARQNGVLTGRRQHAVPGKLNLCVSRPLPRDPRLASPRITVPSRPQPESAVWTIAGLSS